MACDRFGGPAGVWTFLPALLLPDSGGDPAYLVRDLLPDDPMEGCGKCDAGALLAELPGVVGNKKGSQALISGT